MTKRETAVHKLLRDSPGAGQQESVGHLAGRQAESEGWDRDHSRTAKGSAEALLKEALDQGGSDNVTVFVGAVRERKS